MQNIKYFAEKINAYNIEAEDLNTYFVGCNIILVHNKYDEAQNNAPKIGKNYIKEKQTSNKG